MSRTLSSGKWRILAWAVGVVVFALMSAFRASAEEANIVCEGRQTSNVVAARNSPESVSYIFAIDDHARTARVVTPNGYTVQNVKRFDDAEIDFSAEWPGSFDQVWINRLSGGFSSKILFFGNDHVVSGDGYYEGTCHKATKQF